MSAPMTPTLSKRGRARGNSAPLADVTVKRGAVYARYSRERDGTKLSHAKQLAECKARAAADGVDVATDCLFVDQGYSAAEGKHRPAFEALMDCVRAGQIDRVYVSKIDRLTRSTKDFGAMWSDFAAHGVELVSIAEGFDTSTPMGEAMQKIVVVFANLELATIVERNKGTAEYRRRTGMVNAFAPYGYRKSIGTGVSTEGRVCDAFVIDDAQADVIRQLVDKITNGMSLRAACAWLNDNGVPCPSNAPKRGQRSGRVHNVWQYGSLRRILTNPAIAGFRDGHDGSGDYVRAPWAPIVTVAEFDALRDALADKARQLNTATNTTGTPCSPNLLSNLMHCARCGTPMAPYRANGKLRYKCGKRNNPNACCGVSIDGDAAERHVVAELVDAMTGKRWAPIYLHDDDSAAHWQSEIDKLTAAYKRNDLTADQLLELSAHAKAQLAQVEADAKVDRRSSALAQLVGTGGDMAKLWSTLTPDTQRAVIREVFPALRCQPNGKGVSLAVADRVEADDDMTKLVDWRAVTNDTRP